MEKRDAALARTKNKIDRSNFVRTKKYQEFLETLKHRITKARLQVAAKLNEAVLKHYWEIGVAILEKQTEEKWGSGFIKRLSLDLQEYFDGTQGYSESNLKRMRRFAEIYPDFEIGAQAVRQLPWGHIVMLFQKLDDEKTRNWYAEKTLSEGWSRADLEENIKKNLFKRQGSSHTKVSNFLKKLPAPRSEFAQEMLKNPYNFDFLCLSNDAEERDIERATVQHITKTLVELGRGFAFVGQQIPIKCKDQEYFIDLLFYHVTLHSFVVVELKASRFKPEHAGQLNFYLNLVDDFIKSPIDNPSIGILLCKSSDRFMAEYSLKGIEKPIGVSDYLLTTTIPKDFQSSLPSIKEIESELNFLEKNTQASRKKQPNTQAKIKTKTS